MPFLVSTVEDAFAKLFVNILLR
uniref:Uncharacterized protein n=1 Tax=Arundo donax TaxID=35708 RepID=A0A0A8Y4Z3_ARUDO